VPLDGPLLLTIEGTNPGAPPLLGNPFNQHGKQKSIRGIDKQTDVSMMSSATPNVESGMIYRNHMMIQDNDNEYQVNDVDTHHSSMMMLEYLIPLDGHDLDDDVEALSYIIHRYIDISCGTGTK
jgi:hypothetical protein